MRTNSPGAMNPQVAVSAPSGISNSGDAVTPGAWLAPADAVTLPEPVGAGPGPPRRPASRPLPATPPSRGQPLDVFIAGDDDDAKSTVAQLAQDGGLNPIDAGPLKRARELEAMGLLHMTLQGSLGTSFSSTIKILV